MSHPGVLYIVSTPIGNLGDLSFRAVETLKSVSRIACEDTRTSSVLLRHYGIETPTVSFHKFNEHSRLTGMLDDLRAGRDLAVISDAGTPGISDPAFSLVRAAVDAGLEVRSLPGASAVLAALVASGLPPQPFLFLGFAPEKPGDMRRLLQSVQGVAATIVFYDSPHRFRATLGLLRENLGDRRTVIAREITKLHETYHRGNLSELETADIPERGEFVLVVEGAPPPKKDDAELIEMLREALGRGLSLKAAARETAAAVGDRTNRLYRLGLEKNLASTGDDR
jgi:16S rRNA (cytidine1402-2'-O)-methyltransferase